MTDRFTTNPNLFVSSNEFLARVTADNKKEDVREAGFASFKQIFKNSKNSVQVEIEAPGSNSEKLSPYLKRGKNLWSKA